MTFTTTSTWVPTRAEYNDGFTGHLENNARL